MPHSRAATWSKLKIVDGGDRPTGELWSLDPYYCSMGDRGGSVSTQGLALHCTAPLLAVYGQPREWERHWHGMQHWPKSISRLLI